MSIARHHAEWLSLLETSGSFLSLPVLLRVFPQGLDAHDPALARSLRLAHDEWDENRAAKHPDPAIHREWLRFVLEEALGYPQEIILGPDAFSAGLEASVAEHRETLRPDLAIVAPAGRPDSGSPRLLIQLVPPGQGLEKALADATWKVSPASRMTELLKATGVRLGLLTNGEDWMLVHRGESFTYVTWNAPLWFEEPLTLRAFTSLLAARRLFGVADGNTLEALLKESHQNQQEVTDQLGLQVRRAVEVLVQALDRCDKDLGRTLLADVSEKEVYEAVLAVMMRLVFLFSAEERGLLLLGDPLYDRFYAVSTLGAQLREEADRHGQSLLERRHDAWPRLVALFRAVYAGAVHDSLQIPAYGGALFDPDRFPFLEGRPPGTRWRERAAEPLPINNRTVLHVIEALQFLRMKVPGGGPAEPRRLSFRGLGIEQIGHVYEGLLDHSAVRAAAPVLGLLGSREKEEEVPLPELEGYAARGMDDLVEFLTDKTGRSGKTLYKVMSGSLSDPPISKANSNSPFGKGGQGGFSETDLLMACDNNAALATRIRPFAPLLRRDDNDTPLVVIPGSLYVTRTGDRRSTGTHYTPPSLTEPVVKHTIEPLVYDGPADGKPRAEWRLHSPREILALRVCDIAMGSGAFLVQACRYLAERLVEAWEEVERAAPGRVLITPEGDLSAGDPGERLIPRDPDERLTIARRLVADRCLHGVDKNPQAVEMAKLSLWLVTSAKGRPFTFLDHALRCGDSLVGADEETFLKWTQLGGKKAGTLYDDELHRALDVARAKRRELESFEVKDVRDAERKAALLAEAERATARVKLGCDLIIGTKLLGFNARDEKARLLQTFVAFQQTSPALEGRGQGEGGPITDYAVLEPLRESRRTRAFHWHLEFPEVFECGGFSALVGNPPFMGGRYISGLFGNPYLAYLKANLAGGVKGNGDLVAYFYLRAITLMNPRACAGYIGTKTITEGDTLEVGLLQFERLGAEIYRAETSLHWPGEAAVLYTTLHWVCGHWSGPKVLNSREVKFIGPRLDDQMEQEPVDLRQKIQPYQGSYIHGDGFLLTAAQRAQIIEVDPKSEECIFECLTGDDFNKSPSASSDRYVVYFGDRGEDEARRFFGAWQYLEREIKPFRQKYAGTSLAKYWWRFKRPTQPLYSEIWAHPTFLACAVITKYLVFAWLPSRIVIMNKIYAFLRASASDFAVLQSSLYDCWVRKFSANLGETLQFAPTDCFDNFPFPGGVTKLAEVADRYHQIRREIMLGRQEGLTASYNRFHNPKEDAADIARLRDLHVEMDNAVAAAYGWTDLALGHDFHETRQGLRFTLSDPARREVLSRLLALNHARHAEEQAAAHQREAAPTPAKGKHRGRKPTVTPSQSSLFEK